MLILTHSYAVAEWSNACPALKNCREFKTSVCLWLLRAWVQILSVVIFSDNQRLIQIVTLHVFYFLKSYRGIRAFMLLEQLASLSDDWSMLQKLSCFCLKKLNHLSMLITSYIPMLSLWLAISFKFSKLTVKIAINSFLVFLDFKLR